MVVELAHPELGEEVRSIAGYYVLSREQTLGYRGREVLYWIGHGIVDSSCCGTAGCGFALVGGYVREWKRRASQQGTAVSLVEEIRPEEREEVAAIIRRLEPVTQVNFKPICR